MAGQEDLPAVAWVRSLSSKANPLKEFSVTLKEAFKMANLGFRMWNYVREEREEGAIPIIDPFNRDTKPLACHGVPLGGMGGGSIGRGYRGDFRRWQFIPGKCEDTPVLADQFSVFVQRGIPGGKQKEMSSVLFPGRPKELKGKENHWGIGSWDWMLGGDKSVYHALFPRSWTVYSGEPDPELTICCRQVSPFVPHDYKTSSLPCCVFVYSLQNSGKQEAEVCLLFTFANSIGGDSITHGGHYNSQFSEPDNVHGALLHHKSRRLGAPVTVAMAARSVPGVDITVCPRFSVTGRGGNYTARDMWMEIKQNRKFVSKWGSQEATAPSYAGTAIGAAVAATVKVPAGSTREVVFSLAWDSPIVKFNRRSSYYRRYTQFYGQHGVAAPKIAHDALLEYPQWEAAIHNWQKPILTDQTLPKWYRSTLFNELYYLVAGGTIWTDGGPRLEERSDSEWHRSESSGSLDGDVQAMEEGSVEAGSGGSHGEGSHVGSSSGEDSSRRGKGQPLWKGAAGVKLLQPGERNVGQFLYLEGLEYIMWNTYDVHFYASPALLSLFPLLELSLQRDFAVGTLREQKSRVRFLMDNTVGFRKVAGSVPHDLGSKDPWIQLNAYNIHDTSHWKDLNPKFVLQIYRDIVATNDLQFARATWPAVSAALNSARQFDTDGDGLIENEGFPDQTYDAWTVSGPSAYCGGLWLAALQAGAAHATLLGLTEEAASLSTLLAKGREALIEKLWNGNCFNHDSSVQSRAGPTIQADQLAGQWYSRSSGLPSLLPEEMVKQTLQTIFANNVLRYAHGKGGAMNGMLPNGQVDESCMQSREVWTGVTYALAATMIGEGLIMEAFVTAEGIHSTGWIDRGYWFQTPEAWTSKGHFRSLAYMRPLSIWGMQLALERNKGT